MIAYRGFEIYNVGKTINRIYDSGQQDEVNIDVETSYMQYLSLDLPKFLYFLLHVLLRNFESAAQEISMPWSPMKFFFTLSVQFTLALTSCSPFMTGINGSIRYDI